MTGMIFDIQKFSIHDGPGIRTTVFLKGCPLRCVWCHNPESVESGQQLSFLPDRCIGCGYCFANCPQKAHEMVGDAHLIDRTKCVACGLCAKECYAQGLEVVGREATVEEVLKTVLQDLPFYETSGGGMTLSGGEPLSQIDFSEALLKAAKSEHLHCCVETCGFGAFSRIERIMPYVDLFLYDVKDTDNDRHIEFTGVPNSGILSNLRQLHSRGANIIMRLPIVPGLNDRDDHFECAARLAADLPDLKGVEIMPYHRLGESKLKRMAIDDTHRRAAQPPDDATVNAWLDRMASLGVTLLNERRGV